MKAERVREMERELRDAELSTLLRQAYADDPALDAAPGRTERVMRLVLASGVRPKRSIFQWAPLAWAGAGLATASLLVVLALGQMRGMTGDNTLEARNVPSRPSPTQSIYDPAPTPTPPGVTESETATSPVIPSVTERHAPERTTSQEHPTQANQGGGRRTPRRDNGRSTPDQQPSKPEVDPGTTIAVAAPTSGEAGAYMATGDFDKAAEAYFARYQVNGNLDDLMSASSALQSASAVAMSTEPEGTVGG